LNLNEPIRVAQLNPPVKPISGEATATKKRVKALNLI
jgi:hypothetical protein